MTVKEGIQKLLQERSEISIKEIVDNLMVSKQMAHIAMNKLLEEGLVEKLGRTPKTIYRLSKKRVKTQPIEITKTEADFLKQHFLLISETGQLHEGADGFEMWCRQRKLPFTKTISEYIETQKKYQSYFNDRGFIDGMDKLRSTKGYEAIHLDGLYYLDFYAIERFGKTRLGTLLHYAKQGQSKLLMKMLTDEIGQRPEKLTKQIHADAVAFVPPTIRREVQLMKFLQTHLTLTPSLLEIKKISGIIPVPQKSLSKIEERITNAQNTFAVSTPKSYNHVLLIDDAVGSGATVNEIAGKLKIKKIAKKVSALAITGSFKGFDVITDV
jgi:hypothetical protein